MANFRRRHPRWRGNRCYCRDWKLPGRGKNARRSPRDRRLLGLGWHLEREG